MAKLRLMSNNKIDQQWQREGDARTLAQAEEIKANRSRMAGAKKEAAKMAKEKTAQAARLKRVAKKPATTPNRRQPKRKRP